MGLLSMFSTAATGGIPWKWIIIALVALAVIAGVGFTVHAYNSAIENAEESKALLKASAKTLDQEHANLLAAQKNATDLNTYYAGREERNAIAYEKRQAVLSERSARDEKGNIDPANDALLVRLNSLFRRYTSAAGNGPKGAALPSGVPGHAAGGQIPGMPGPVLSH